VAIPYRRVPLVSETGIAAFLDVNPATSDTLLIGALLLMDTRGQPLEFVHNAVPVPDGFLWPRDRVDTMAVAALARSLFDACRREPDLLLCLPSLGDAGALRAELAPSIPFALVPGEGDDAAAWTWVNDPPSPGMRASVVREELIRRGLVWEPFSRIRNGLREIYYTSFAADGLSPDDDG
jgi:hypothetical protein